MLDTVLAERSVVRAARRLHVTPSAVSNGLARLRAALDDPLLIRSGRGIVPTPRAAALAPALARALRDLEQAVHGEGFDPATTDRELTLAIADAGQVVKLPRSWRRWPRRCRARGSACSASIRCSRSAAWPGRRSTSRSAPARRDRASTRSRCSRSASCWWRASPTRGSAAGSRRPQLAALRHVEVQVAPGRGSRPLAASYAALGVARDIAVVVPTFTAAAAIVAATDHVASLPASLVDVLARAAGAAAGGDAAPASRDHHQPALARAHPARPGPARLSRSADTRGWPANRFPAQSPMTSSNSLRPTGLTRWAAKPARRLASRSDG